jgi:N-ethylmaleimide reductase
MTPAFETAALLTPGRLGPYTLPHRVLMAPMTRNRARRHGVPSTSAVIYYAQRASAGMIVTETTTVSEQATGYPLMPGIHTADQVAGWRPVVDAVHRFGCRVFLQLFHAGRVSHPSLQPGAALPVAPSPIPPNGETPTYQGLAPFVAPRSLALEEIPGIIEQFRVAAQNALVAGFDGVEIHGANGYLLDQFLRDGSNRRADAYGGSVANRIRLLLEVTDAVADVWGADRVGVRISPLNAFNSMFDSDPGTTFGTLVNELARLGLAYLHVVEEGLERESAARFDIGDLRAAWKGPYIVNGNYDYSRATQVIANGRADFVSFGKSFLANPDLPLRFARRAPLNVPDRASFYGGDDRGYIDYPFLEDPGPVLRQLVLAAGGSAAHLSFAGDGSTSPVLTANHSKEEL